MCPGQGRVQHSLLPLQWDQAGMEGGFPFSPPVSSHTAPAERRGQSSPWEWGCTALYLVTLALTAINSKHTSANTP